MRVNKRTVEHAKDPLGGNSPAVAGLSRAMAGSGRHHVLCRRRHHNLRPRYLHEDEVVATWGEMAIILLWDMFVNLFVIPYEA